jgi:hypothetical protein
MTAIFVSGCHRAMGSSSDSKIASVLNEQFETVFYAKADFLKGLTAYKELSARTANSLRSPFSDLLGGLQPLGDQVPTQIFGAANAVFVGARNFQPPHGLGAVQSDFCFVVALRSGSQFDIANVAKTSSLVAVADGVWTWQIKPTEGRSTHLRYFALQNSHAYLVISSDKAILRTITAELASNNHIVVGVPNEIYDWDSLSQYDLWGYRHYRHKDLDKNAAGTSDVTATATALLFVVDANKKSAVLRLLASDGTTAEKMNASGKLPKLKPSDASSWQTTISLANNQGTVEQVLALMWLFGFGVYL